jgi:hypothetical protein
MEVCIGQKGQWPERTSFGAPCPQAAPLDWMKDFGGPLIEI